MARKTTLTPNDGTVLTEVVPHNITYHESELDRVKNRIKRLEVLLADSNPPKWLTDELRKDYTTELALHKCELTLLALSTED